MPTHPSEFAGFTMFDDAARTELLPDRSKAGLLVTIGGRHRQTTMADLPRFIPPGSVLVLNQSGTFFARYPDARLADGRQATVHFAQMLDESGFRWVVVAPQGLEVGSRIDLPGDACLTLEDPYMVRGVQAKWEQWGRMWTAQFDGKQCFEHFQAEHGHPIRYPYDHVNWTSVAMQNCFSGRPTSAMMNNGGRNLTPGILRTLTANGVQLARLEMRTGVGVDHSGYPLPEFTQLGLVDALTINAAIADGRLVIPVGTGVVRALDYLHNPNSGQVQPGSGWCDNTITPETGTWLKAWLSGMHEPRSTHLAMGAAVMGERVMRDAMTTAHRWGMKFHENGDSHLVLPAAA